MASSSQSLNRHGDNHDDGNLRRVTRARHAANTKGKGTISTSADHHQDEYGDELNRELNRERNEGGELADERADELVDEQADQDRDVREEVRELSTKLDTLLTSFKTYMIKAGSTAQTMDQLPDPSLNQQQPRQQPISPQERIDEMPSPSPSHDDNISISSNNSIKISDLSKELMKLIPRYDGSGGAVKLFEFINQYEDFASNTDYTPSMELTLATAKLNGDAKIWWRDHRNTIAIDHSQRIKCWSQLRKALIEHFTPPEHVYTIRNKLFNLKQNASVADYNASFM